MGKNFTFCSLLLNIEIFPNNFSYLILYGCGWAKKKPNTLGFLLLNEHSKKHVINMAFFYSERKVYKIVVNLEY